MSGGNGSSSSSCSDGHGINRKQNIPGACFKNETGAFLCDKGGSHAADKYRPHLRTRKATDAACRLCR